MRCGFVFADGSRNKASSSKLPPRSGTDKSGWLWNRRNREETLHISRKKLNEINVRPRKSMGQNFMLDEGVLQQIASQARISAFDPILEVGPGTGALTNHLIQSKAAITAIEKDENLVNYLRDTYRDENMLQILHGDVLRMDLPKVLDDTNRFAWKNSGNKGDQEEFIEESRVKIVSNLPYNITKDFMLRAMPLGDKCSTLLLMLQHEVAERLTTQEPGASDWRSINILIQYYTLESKYLFRVDRYKYCPRPKVDGGVVEFKLRRPADRPSVPDEKQFRKIVHKAFLQKRKTLKNSLQPLVSASEASNAMASIGLGSEARAQNLTLTDFVKLSWALHDQGSIKLIGGM